MLRPGQLLYTYLHLAPDPEQTAALVKSGAVCVAYETITGANGGLPLLAPMSEVAGRMSIQAGAAHLEKSKGGMGVLLGGVPGVAPAHVVILGAGVVGTHALQCAVGAGARVTVLDKNVDRLRQLDLVFGNRITTLYSSAHDVITTPITFSREISRLVNLRCAVCHREGGSAFSLLTYEQARPWAKAIKEEVLERRMPPWGAVKGFGDFKDDQGLTEEQIKMKVLSAVSGTPRIDDGTGQSGLLIRTAA